jgi:glycosyltransferase involved in cell wall biosynthesis
MKDHQNFFRAASRVHAEYPDLHFVLAGNSVDWDNKHLRKMIQEFGLVERSHLLGEREDMPRLTAALDIAVSSSSYGEGFPNVIGEAMSCAVPCAVTEISDAPQVVGDTGLVVPTRDPESLRKALASLIELGHDGRRALGVAARARVTEHFQLGSIVAQYEDFYASILGTALPEKRRGNVRYHRFRGQSAFREDSGEENQKRANSSVR